MDRRRAAGTPSNISDHSVSDMAPPSHDSLIKFSKCGRDFISPPSERQFSVCSVSNETIGDASPAVMFVTYALANQYRGS